MKLLVAEAALNSEQSDRGKGIERKYTHYTGGQIKKQYCHKVKGTEGVGGGGASATYARICSILLQIVSITFV